MIQRLLSFPLVAMIAATLCGAPSSVAQQASTMQASKPAPPAAAPDASAIPPGEAVITVEGLCAPEAAKKPAASAKTATAKPTSAKSSTPGGPCKTQITKEEFEKLLNLNPANQNLPPAARRRLAQSYVDILTFADAGLKAGVEKDPNFATAAKLGRLQTIASFYRERIQQTGHNIQPAEIQAYYDQNIQKYQEIKLSRIFIPAKNPANPNGPQADWDQKASDVANKIRDRMAKGEDLDKLQKEAYTDLGLTITPPPTNAGTRRRSQAPLPQEQELFSLKTGEVSKVEQEPAGYVTYKVENNQTLPLDSVKNEITNMLARQKIEQEMKAITEPVHAEFAEQYFGPANPAPPQPAPRGNAIPFPAPKAPGPQQPAAPAASAGSAPASPQAQAPPK